MKAIPKLIFWSAFTFNQKILRYKRYLGKDHAPYVDKLSAKEIAKEHGVEVAPLVRVLSSPEDLTRDDLKSGRILKASHGSGWNIILNESQNIDDIITTLKFWNRTFDINSEPQYKYIPPRFFIEELINDKYLKQTGSLVYMIRCIYGKPIPNVRVRYNGKVNSYDFSWKQIESPELPFQIEKPKHLEEMIRMASKMSKKFEFVRMDFYVDEHDTVYFSEYTFTPGGGYSMHSEQLERIDSAYWQRF